MTYTDIYSDFYGGAEVSMAGGGLIGRDLQILVRNPDLSLNGELEYHSVELVPRYNALGSWTLDVGFDGDLDSPAGTLLLPGAGIVAVANGKIVMSGPVTKPARQRDGDTNHLSIGGTDDLQCIADRVAHQDPAHADTTQADHTYLTAEDARSGVAETVIKEFVDANAGPGAIATRECPGLDIDIDRGLGVDVEESGRMQNLLELIANLGKAGGVGFRLTQTGLGMLAFIVYTPTDKTDEVVFSVGLGNVHGYEYSAERPTGNAIYGGGNGEGAARIFRIKTDSASVDAWGRIESFVDDSSSSITKIDQNLRAELAGSAARYFFSADAVDTGTHQWAPLATSTSVQTYDLGDIVSVVVDGQRISEVIRELHVTQDPDGRTVTPIVGSADQGGRREQRFFESIGASIRTMRTQVRDLQRR